MRKLIGSMVGLAAATLLVACGGGGGSPGDTPESYTITLRAAKTSLPLNVAHYPPGIGVDAPFTTTLYVSAKKGDAPIPGGEDVFACNTAYGLDSGPLYYLDGKSEHETEVDDGQGGKVKVPNAYRNITLGANAGGNSFHFHAGNQAGVATITCSVHDPRANREVSASVEITVGGGAGTGMAASIRGVAQHDTLGTQGNTSNLRTSTAISAYVWDDANQPIPANGKPNVQVTIVGSRAAGAPALGARLLAGAQQGSTVQVSTTGGVGLFSLSSGPNRGPILLELKSDRRDNDVSNGIQDEVRHLLVVWAVEGVASTPLSLAAASFDVPNATPFGVVLSATGGRAPYSWTALDALPTGLSLSDAGVLQGTPRVPPGTYVVRVRVTDALDSVADATVTLKITGPLAPPLVFTASAITAEQNLPFSYALTASGGVPPYTWTALGPMPAGLTFSGAGVITGTPTAVGAYSIAVRVTDSAGTSVTQNLAFTVEAP